MRFYRLDTGCWGFGAVTGRWCKVPLGCFLLSGCRGGGRETVAIAGTVACKLCVEQDNSCKKGFMERLSRFIQPQGWYERFQSVSEDLVEIRKRIVHQIRLSCADPTTRPTSGFACLLHAFSIPTFSIIFHYPKGPSTQIVGFQGDFGT